MKKSTRGAFCPHYGASDGANLVGRIDFIGQHLYRTEFNGGSSGHGTMFAVNTDGTGFPNLYSFNPIGGLTLTNSSLYWDGKDDFPVSHAVVAGLKSV